MDSSLGTIDINIERSKYEETTIGVRGKLTCGSGIIYVKPVVEAMEFISRKRSARRRRVLNSNTQSALATEKYTAGLTP